MICFWNKEYHFDLTGDDFKSKAEGKFEVIDHKNSFRLKRKRIIPHEGVVHVVIPELIVKTELRNDSVKCSIKLGGVAVFMVLLCLVVIILELYIDSKEPIKAIQLWFPIVLLFWYVLVISVEMGLVIRSIKAIFNN